MNEIFASDGYEWTNQQGSSGLGPNLVELFVDPAKPVRKVIVQSVGDLASDVTYWFICTFQGRVTFKMPMRINSGTALTTLAPFTGPYLFVSRGAPGTDAVPNAMIWATAGVSNARVAAPFSLYVTCDKITLQKIADTGSNPAANVNVVLACRSTAF